MSLSTPPMPSPSASQSHPNDESIDFAELFARVRRGFLFILGLALIGFAVGIFFTLVATTRQPAVSSLRVTFGFPGFERGVYPNGSKFQTDDIRAPDVINEAIKRLDLGAQTPDLASKIRGAISITGFVSPNIVKERDRLRAVGQNLPPYIPDEYEISLSLPRKFPLDVRQRELLLAEIVNTFQEKFRRVYVELPPEFGNAFSSLKGADFVEYELILTKEMQSLSDYLDQKLNNDNNSKETRMQVGATKQFRSPTNNLSFQDLLKQSELFTQIRLNDVLSQIYIYGLSKDRKYALVKMDYYLRTLEDQEQRLKEEEAVVTNLLGKTQDRAQNYVLATKAQNPQGAQPLMDQSFIDSLLANDAYNFLVRRALDAGLAVKRIQSEKARMLERRQRMESFAKGEVVDQAVAIANTQTALTDLEAKYQELLGKVRVVLEDYSRQEYADAVRISMQATTNSFFTTLALGAFVGLAAGVALALGVSLIRPASNAPQA
jgi:hypothetical protein